MKIITIISTVTKLIFILLVFVSVKNASDYFLVPILYSIGYTIGGVVAMYVIFNKNKLRFFFPDIRTIWFYAKDSLPILATDLLCSIKDRFNYMLVGIFSSMGNVVVYDLSLKINGLISQPLSILCTVLFPRFAQNHNKSHAMKLIYCSFLITSALVILVNVFLPQISFFFLGKSVDLLPIRLFSIAPLFLSISAIISTNVFVAWSYNKYVVHSILITTSVYIVAIVYCLVTSKLSSIYSFVVVALISYITEFLYRVFALRKVFVKEQIQRK